MHVMKEASHNPFEQPLVVDSDLVCLPEFGDPTCPSTFDLQLHRGEGSGVGSSAGSESGHLDVIESIVTHDGASRVPQQTGVTTFNHRDGVYGGLSHDPMLGFDMLSQDLYDVHQHRVLYDGLSNRDWDILCNGQASTDGEIVDAAPGFVEAGNDKDRLAIELEESVGPGRPYHRIGTSDETQGPGSVSSSSTHGDLASNWPFASCPCPQKSTAEATHAIQRAEEPEVLRRPTIGSHSQGVKTALYGTESVSTYRHSVAVMRKLLTAMTACSTLLTDDVRFTSSFSAGEVKSPPREARWKTSSFPSSAARQIRIHESPQGVIQRMMPLDRTILFGVDTESFRRAGVEANDIDRIIEAACVVAGVFGVRKLGIAFAYVPGPGPKVFSIRYDLTLSGRVAAEAFLPSDPREDWQVRISPAAFPSWNTSGDRYYMIRTLAHEFMHILGFRHHNAGSNEVEASSMHWPGTVDGNSYSIMYTSVHSRLWFSEEDMRAIQEFYSKPNMTLMRDRWVIMNVDPYDGSRVS